jgi:hypothetical protein
MTCERCAARMVPHTDAQEETTWICPVCGSAVFGFPDERLGDDIREYWLDRTHIFAG